MSLVDPWSWSVDEVVNAFCNSRELWKERPGSALPDPEVFERILRSNSVNGSTLLEHVDHASLKDDLEIWSLGQRSSILHAIDCLRRQSRHYTYHQATLSSSQHKVNDKTSTASPTTSLLRGFTATRESSANDLPSARPGEILVGDGHSQRKRRRLDLSKLASHLNLETVDPANGHSHRYLGVPSIFLDDLFFDHVSTTQDRTQNYVYNKFSIATSVDSNFSFVSSDNGIARGHRIFNARRIRHLLLENEFEIDESTRVIYPYPVRLIKQGRGQSTIMFRRIDGVVQVQKRDAVMLKSNLVYQDDGSETHEFDWLSKWANLSEDEVLPIYGESDSEIDIDEETAAEIQREQEDDSRRTRLPCLTEEEVSVAIDEAVEALVKKWEDTKLPLREWKAWSVWRLAQGRRKAFIDRARWEVRRFESRLENLKKGLKEEVWTSSGQIKKQSLCMEQTIFERQDQLWKIDIYTSKHCPTRPTRKAPRQRSPIALDENGDDVEILESDSEASDQFIDDDVESSDIMRDSDTNGMQLKSPTSRDRWHTPQEIISSPKDSADEFPGFIQGNVSSNNSDFSKDSVIRIVKTTETGTKNEVIDLSLSSPEGEPATPISIPSALGEMFSNHPESDTIEDIAKWDITFLEELSDRKRLVLKIFHEKFSSRLQEQVKRRIRMDGHVILADDILNGLGALKRKDSTLPGRDEKASEQIRAMSRLYLCWVVCLDRFNQELNDGLVNKALKAAKAKRSGTEPFIQFFKDVMEAHKDRNDSLGLSPMDTPNKRRKGTVKQNQDAKKIRMAAQQRYEEGGQREQKLLESIGAPALSSHDHGVIINTQKLDYQDIIYVNPHIGSRIKGHQIDGIRFMWREIVAAAGLQEHESPGQGCLLAHTMGLGKTMQTITTLVTIAESVRSPNPRISEQVPKHLHSLRTLILCPPGLIENWGDELHSWMPNTANIGPVTQVADVHKPEERREIIARWYNQSGVLIMGYEMFRGFILNKIENEKIAQHVANAMEATRDQLLQGPSIVVADEAHRLKNTKSKLSIAAARFKTHSRIALTGSPLANNLSDYYAMINWVAPNYLGDAVEFKAHFQEPIQEGFYVESTPTERRKALKTLRVLENVLGPKVNRADISVLKGTLEPKTEFVIKIPLTNIQEEAYRLFVRSLVTTEEVANTRLWSWMHILALLCNHPKAFLSELEKRNSTRQKKFNTPSEDGMNDSTPSVTDSGDEQARNGTIPSEQDIAQLHLPDIMLQQQRDLFEPVKDIEATNLAYKMVIIVKILEEARQIGDRTLVFSHNLATLTYIENLLRRNEFRYKRLDGTTKIFERQNMSKEFNRSDFHVMLISTRAGGLGINLPGANRVILVDFNFNPTWEEQAVGRAYRIGQQKPVYVYHFVVGGTFEETMHNQAMFKTQLAFRVVDKKKPQIYASKTRDFLFEPKMVPQDIAGLEQFKGKDKIMDTILTDPSCGVRGLETAETLHRETDERLTEEEMQEVATMQQHENLRLTNRVEWQKLRTYAQMKELQSARETASGGVI